MRNIRFISWVRVKRLILEHTTISRHTIAWERRQLTCMTEAPKLFLHAYSLVVPPPTWISEAPRISKIPFDVNVLKILLKGVKQTNLKFRFRVYRNESRTFWRRLRESLYQSIPQLFYDRLWTDSDYDKTFTFHWKLKRNPADSLFIDELDLSNKNDITNRTPFVYVDIPVPPALMVRQLHAPQTSGVPKYELKVYDKDELKEVGIVS